MAIAQFNDALAGAILSAGSLVAAFIIAKTGDKAIYKKTRERLVSKQASAVAPKLG